MGGRLPARSGRRWHRGVREGRRARAARRDQDRLVAARRSVRANRRGVVRADQGVRSGRARSMGYADMSDEVFRSIEAAFARRSAWYVYPDVVPAVEAMRHSGLRLGVISNFVWGGPELIHDLALARHFDGADGLGAGRLPEAASRHLRSRVGSAEGRAGQGAAYRRLVRRRRPGRTQGRHRRSAHRSRRRRSGAACAPSTTIRIWWSSATCSSCSTCWASNARRR